MRTLSLLALLLVCFSAKTQTKTFSIAFDTDVSTLNKQQKDLLYKLATDPCTDFTHLFILGFADTTGDFEYNLALSRKRAEAVSDYMMRFADTTEFKQFLPVVKWFGESIDCIDERATGAQKRMVDIVFYMEPEPETEFVEVKKKPKAKVTDLLAQLGDPEQHFGFDPMRDTILIGARGTMVYIPAGSFYVAGSCAGQQATFTMKEAYDPESVFANGLTTVAYNGLLESGGMVYLHGNICNRDLELKPGKALTVMMPNVQNKGDMQLFQGERGKDGLVYWNATDAQVGNGSYRKLIRWKRYWRSYYSKMECPFFFCKIDNFFSYGHFNVDWAYAKRYYYRDAQNMDSLFRAYGVKDVTALYRAMEEERLNAIRDKYKVGDATGEDMQTYVFTTNQMGWMNCDRYMEYPKEQQADVFVYQEPADDIRIGFFFTEYNSALPANPLLNKYQIKGVLKGEYGWVFALRNNNGTPEYSVQQVSVKKDMDVTPIFKSCTLDQLHEIFADMTSQ